MTQEINRPELNLPPIKVWCPWCKSSPGEMCKVAGTSLRPNGGYHSARVENAVKLNR